MLHDWFAQQKKKFIAEKIDNGDPEQFNREPTEMHILTAEAASLSLRWGDWV